MAYQRLLANLGLTLLTASLLLHPTSQTCQGNCLSCLVDTCSSCFEQKLTASGECSDSPLDADPNCWMYSAENPIGLCYWCKEGYALNSLTGRCVLSHITNSEMSFIPLQQAETVLACKGGKKPSLDRKRCIDLPEDETVENCLYVALCTGNQPACLRCRPGYTVVEGKCLFTNLPGCLVESPDRSKCLMCDGFKGWFSRKGDLSCQRV